MKVLSSLLAILVLVSSQDCFERECRQCTDDTGTEGPKCVWNFITETCYDYRPDPRIEQFSIIANDARAKVAKKLKPTTQKQQKTLKLGESMTDLELERIYESDPDAQTHSEASQWVRNLKELEQMFARSIDPDRVGKQCGSQPSGENLENQRIIEETGVDYRAVPQTCRKNNEVVGFELYKRPGDGDRATLRVDLKCGEDMQMQSFDLRGQRTGEEEPGVLYLVKSTSPTEGTRIEKFTLKPRPARTDPLSLIDVITFFMKVHWLGDEGLLVRNIEDLKRNGHKRSWFMYQLLGRWQCADVKACSECVNFHVVTDVYNPRARVKFMELDCAWDRRSGECREKAFLRRHDKEFLETTDHCWMSVVLEALEEARAEQEREHEKRRAEHAERLKKERERKIEDVVKVDKLDRLCDVSQIPQRFRRGDVLLGQLYKPKGIINKAARLVGGMEPKWVWTLRAYTGKGSGGSDGFEEIKIYYRPPKGNDDVVHIQVLKDSTRYIPSGEMCENHELPLLKLVEDFLPRLDLSEQNKQGAVPKFCP